MYLLRLAYLYQIRTDLHSVNCSASPVKTHGLISEFPAKSSYQVKVQQNTFNGTVHIVKYLLKSFTKLTPNTLIRPFRKINFVSRGAHARKSASTDGVLLKVYPDTSYRCSQNL